MYSHRINIPNGNPLSNLSIVVSVAPEIAPDSASFAAHLEPIIQSRKGKETGMLFILFAIYYEHCQLCMDPMNMLNVCVFVFFFCGGFVFL